LAISRGPPTDRQDEDRRVGASDLQLQVFAVTTLAEDNHPELELAVIEFLQQIRINATVHIVNMQNTDLADDFRTQTFELCPGGAPTLTVGEKFRAMKDDAISTSSSVSAGQGLQSFLPLGDRACLPSTQNSKSNSNVPGSPGKKSSDFLRQYFAFAGESTTSDPSQQFLCLQTAQKFNSLIRRNSAAASLVVTHLPIPHKVTKANDFMEYLDTMFKDVDNMLLIQGTGVEYLTTVA